jgi:hypothetical protein
MPRLLPFELSSTTGTIAASEEVSVDTSNFDGNLSGTVTDMQQLAQAVDDLNLGNMGGTVTAANVSVDNPDVSGLISSSGNAQVAFNRINGTGLGSAPVTFQGSFFPNYLETGGNQDTWYDGKQAGMLVGQSSTNRNNTFELPDIDELTSMFDDLASRGLGEVYERTITYTGGTFNSVVRNSLTIRPPSVSALFDRNEFPVTIARGAFVTIRITRVGGSIQQWERVDVGQSVDPVATFGEVVLQNVSWNNADSSFLPSGMMVQKGYAFPVFSSNPNDGTLRQGLLDAGVSDRLIYDGDYVVWAADAFTSWTNGDDWFVINRDSLQRMSREQSNFLAQISEIDNRVELAPINVLGSEGVVWVSENPLAEAPFINPSSDPNNPRSGDSYRYIGGRDNRDSTGFNFQFSQNRFNSYLTVGITPNFANAHNARDILINIRDTDRNLIESFNLQDDFTFVDDATFTNTTYRHYQRNTSVNYPFLATIEVVLSQVQEHFRLNANTVEVTQNIPADALQENQLSSDIRSKLNRALPPAGVSYESIEDRLSPYKTITNISPSIEARFASASTTDPYPSSLNDFTHVSASNPRFTATDVVMFVAVPSGGAYSLKNITANTVIALDNSEATVEAVESFTSGGVSYFVYRVTSIVSANVYEVDIATSHQVVAWADDLRNLEDDIERIDAELSHAILNLDDEVVHVFENDVSVSEETNVNVVPTDYNRHLAGAANTTQTVFRETTPNAPSGGLISSKPINETTGDRARRKLIYLPAGIVYQNQAYLTAFDGATGRDLITYANGQFFVSTRVNGTPATTTTNTIYPAPATLVSGANYWQTIPALTFVNGVPVSEADELFFTRNIPTSPTTLTIQYRGHANGNIFGTNTITLANVGGDVDQFATFTLSVGSENVDVEVRYYASRRQIRVSETARVVRGLPTINDVQVILSYTETRTTPATQGHNQDVLLEHEHEGAQVFAIKPSSSGNLIIVGDRQEIDTNRPYTTLFGATEAGFLTVTDEGATFLDYEDFDPINVTVTDLENHASLPQFGLFTNDYTNETDLNFSVGFKVQRLNIGDIPTSSTGLSSGDVWNDSGTLKIV